MKSLLWLIPLLPFLGALLNGVVLKGRISNKAVSWIACGLVGLACLIGIGAVASYLGGAEHAAGQGYVFNAYSWVPAGELVSAAGKAPLTIDLAFLLDPLSCVMLFVVTFVGFWIHVYSVSYMGHEKG